MRLDQSRKSLWRGWMTNEERVVHAIGSNDFATQLGDRGFINDTAS